MKKDYRVVLLTPRESEHLEFFDRAIYEFRKMKFGTKEILGTEDEKGKKVKKKE